MYATFNRFEIEMTLEQARSASHSGDCLLDVRELLDCRKIARQLDKIGPEKIAKELDEYGCWDEAELADEAANRSRIVWMAACDIAEEHQERSRIN